MRPCLSEATTMTATFVEDVEACAAAGCDALEVWLTKLEQHLEQSSLDATRGLVDDRGVSLVAASYQGGLLLSEGAARAAHYDHFRRRLQLCDALRIPTLLIVADFAERMTSENLDRAIASLREAARWADGFGVRLALEFRATDTFCSNLETAVRIVDACGEPNVGVNWDAFHFFKGSSKTEDLELLSPANLAFVQVCDWSGIPRELVTDADRIMPGDGDLPLLDVLRRLKRLGYAGPVSLELLNPVFWQMKPTQVMELGAAAVRRVLPV